MQQNINLFDHLERRESIAVSSQHIAAAALMMVLVLMLVSLFSTYKGSQDARRLQQAELDYEGLQAQLTALRAGSSNDSKTIQHTKRLLKQRRQILQSLSKQQKDIGQGFSAHLEGLGRQQLTGLWLSSIILRAGGEQISLKGKMQQAKLLPRYLQDLGKEQAFSGLRFQLMKIENGEANHHQMQFEVSVASEQTDEGREA